MKILISDDDVISRLLLKTNLKDLGHEVVETRNGREAWDGFRKEYFPMLIADWLMPEVDGVELIRRIRAEKRNKYTYILLITGMGGKDIYLEGMKAGADDFVTKPFDEDQLAARVRVAERILSLQTEVKKLQELLPICSYCKKIRKGGDYWQRVEEYIGEQMNLLLSHSICPECYEKVIKPQLDEFERPRREL